MDCGGSTTGIRQGDLVPRFSKNHRPSSGDTDPQRGQNARDKLRINGMCWSLSLILKLRYGALLNFAKKYDDVNKKKFRAQLFAQKHAHLEEINV